LNQLQTLRRTITEQTAQLAAQAQQLKAHAQREAAQA
jgi:hypothetical protein